MVKKNYGWVLYCNKVKNYVGLYVGLFMWEGFCLRDAKVYDTRQEARNAKCSCDSVRKVSLTKNGKPKKVIGVRG